MGAPGTSYWTGSVLVFNTSSLEMSGYLDYETGAVTFGSYLGKKKNLLLLLAVFILIVTNVLGICQGKILPIERMMITYISVFPHILSLNWYFFLLLFQT